MGWLRHTRRMLKLKEFKFSPYRKCSNYPAAYHRSSAQYPCCWQVAVCDDSSRALSSSAWCQRWSCTPNTWMDHFRRDFSCDDPSSTCTVWMIIKTNQHCNYGQLWNKMLTSSSLTGVLKSHNMHFIIGIEWYLTCLLNLALICVTYEHFSQR